MDLPGFELLSLQQILPATVVESYHCLLDMLIALRILRKERAQRKEYCELNNIFNHFRYNHTRLERTPELDEWCKEYEKTYNIIPSFDVTELPPRDPSVEIDYEDDFCLLEDGEYTYATEFLSNAECVLFGIDSNGFGKRTPEVFVKGDDKMEITPVVLPDDHCCSSDELSNGLIEIAPVALLHSQDVHPNLLKINDALSVRVAPPDHRQNVSPCLESLMIRHPSTETDPPCFLEVDSPISKAELAIYRNRGFGKGTDLNNKIVSISVEVTTERPMSRVKLKGSSIEYLLDNVDPYRAKVRQLRIIGMLTAMAKIDCETASRFNWQQAGGLTIQTSSKRMCARITLCDRHRRKRCGPMLRKPT